MGSEQPVQLSSEHEKAREGSRGIPNPRRQYNREYMRRWRMNPAHLMAEHTARQRAYQTRKERKAQFKPGEHVNERGEPVCAFCGMRPPVENVTRLQVCDLAPDGYVEVLIPYCGYC